jgi:hypothetical protein
MARKLSGGGLTSNKLVRPGVKAGPANTNVVNPRGVSQYGYATGSEISRTGSYTTKNTSLPVNAGTMPQIEMGNKVAASTVCGVGGSRTIYRTGGQGVQGSVVPGNAKQGRDIFAQFPPETSSQSSLVRKR